MFKNPLKYQQGGAAPSQQEQQVLAAFIQWLPKRVKEFQGMQPEQIAQALDGMSKTPEGKKQLQQLMAQFQQEMQGGSQAFRQGGKIHDFICKHAKGGNLKGCGCKQEGGEINQYGPGGWLRNLFRRDPQGVRQVNVTGFDPDGSSSDPFYGSEMTETLPNAHQRKIRSNWWGVGQEPVRDTSIVTPAGKVSNSDENWRSENEAFDRAKYIELPGTTINEYVDQKDRLRNPGEMECGGKVEKHQEANGKIGVTRGMYQASDWENEPDQFTLTPGGGYARNYRLPMFGGHRWGIPGNTLRQVLITFGDNGTPRKAVRDLKGYYGNGQIDTVIYDARGNKHNSPEFEARVNSELEGMDPHQRPAKKEKCGGNIKKPSKVRKGQNGFLNLWQSAYNSKFGKGLRDFMFGTDSDLSNEEYVKKHGYSKPIMGMPPAVKISYIPEGVYGSTKMAEQAAKAAKEAAKFKHVSPLDGGRLGHTIKDVSGIHLKNDGGKVEKAQEGDIMLQPGEETVWDIKKDTLRNGTLESHKWAKNNSTLPMPESEVRQWPGTYTRFIDGRDTILVRQTPMFKFYRSNLDPLHEIVTYSDGTPAGTNTYGTRDSWNKENQYHDKLK